MKLVEATALASVNALEHSSRARYQGEMLAEHVEILLERRRI